MQQSRSSMPKPTPAKPSRKPSPRTSTKSAKKSPSGSARKRKPPQKNPPKPKNRLGKNLLSLLVAAGLIVLGYWLGRPADRLEKRIDSPRTHRLTEKAPTRVGTIHVAEKSGESKASGDPTKLPTAMEILQYGFEEDAQGEEAMPEISWYEPDAPKPSASPVAPPPRTQPPVPPRTPMPTGTRPRLVIIIDDVAHARQLKAIRVLPWHITPSIFPPSEIASSSPKLARHLKHYMVHLPMQSGSEAMNRMKGMLFANASAATIEARVKEIRHLFPTAKYINNHTGSVFTANPKAMKTLYAQLRKRGFSFVDSRTTAKSVVRPIARSYGDPYIARDVFIDNTQQVAAILKQLKKAVRIAKKRGYAIAIGHPHKATMKALRQAEPILKGVQTVYIDELYR